MKVVVPIDKMLVSQPLFDVLMGMKWRAGTQIVLLTVAPKWVSGPDTQVSIPQCVQEMESLAVELRNALPFCEVSFFVREGDPKIEIPSFARVMGADLIVVPAAGYTNQTHLRPEDISESIISHAHCPVLVAKANYDTIDSAQAGFHNVLIPVDDSVYADVALKWLLNFRWFPQTRFIISSMIEHEGVRQIATESLLRRAQFLSTILGTTNIFMEVRTDNPTRGIIRLAQDTAADLIVIGSHGRVGIRRLLFGSVSEKLARKGPCSIAIIRGIAQADDSWHRTGVFKQPKLHDFESPRNYRHHGYSGDNHSTPHVVPGGMR